MQEFIDKKELSDLVTDFGAYLLSELVKMSQATDTQYRHQIAQLEATVRSEQGTRSERAIAVARCTRCRRPLQESADLDLDDEELFAVP
jgi:hypothetical protein